jgi:hypothetical protein
MEAIVSKYQEPQPPAIALADGLAGGARSRGPNKNPSSSSGIQDLST